MYPSPYVFIPNNDRDNTWYGFSIIYTKDWRVPMRGNAPCILEFTRDGVASYTCIVGMHSHCFFLLHVDRQLREKSTVLTIRNTLIQFFTQH